MSRRQIWIIFAIITLASDSTTFADQPIVLRVSNWGGPGVDPSFMRVEREIKDGFEQQHPGVRVQIESIPGPTNQCYVPKLLMMFIAGNPPDVIALDASSAAVFINNNLLTDLMPLMATDTQFDLRQYFPTALDIARRGQKLFAVPLDFTPMVIIYNRKLFREAGVAYPKAGWSRDEFLIAAKKLSVHEPGKPDRYGLFFQKEMSLWFPWIWAAGTDVLSPDGLHAVGYLDSPKTIDAIQFLVDLIRKHGVANQLSQSATAGVDLFRAGRAAMTMTGHWMLIEYRVDKLEIGIATIPVENRNAKIESPVTVMYETGLAIARSSPRKRLAWDYVKYMTSAEVQKKRVASGLAISGNMKAAAFFAGTEVEDAFLEAVKFARPPWGSRCERYELVEDLGREMIEDILNGGVPVKDAVSRTAKLIEQQLSREK